ncbi:hypothetical protein [uncultured Methanosphaera sp.]|uniref:hypothetical protein n=1 Tax=uncultured Methanosphaera sp. TaxID=262501 RepID=UPI00280B4C37|nr:hypothetical protein [uncultured Methanosphaera sp.]
MFLNFEITTQKKIQKFFNWYKKHENQDIQDIPDTADKKLESRKKVASWRRIARAIERNDFWMIGLSFSKTKTDTKFLYNLKEKYKNIIEKKTQMIKL